LRLKSSYNYPLVHPPFASFPSLFRFGFFFSRFFLSLVVFTRKRPGSPITEVQLSPPAGIPRRFSSVYHSDVPIPPLGKILPAGHNCPFKLRLPPFFFFAHLTKDPLFHLFDFRGYLFWKVCHPSFKRDPCIFQFRPIPLVCPVFPLPPFFSGSSLLHSCTLGMLFHCRSYPLRSLLL